MHNRPFIVTINNIDCNIFPQMMTSSKFELQDIFMINRSPFCMFTQVHVQTLHFPLEMMNFSCKLKWMVTSAPMTWSNWQTCLKIFTD